MGLVVPKHIRCNNCGECCGPAPVTEKERNEIVLYVVKNKPKYNKNAGFIDCKFRVDNKCSIYEVRPLICKLFGVTKGLVCINGNTKNMNPPKLMFENKAIGIINDVIVTDYDID